jgi:hypothetical protein
MYLLAIGTRRPAGASRGGLVGGYRVRDAEQTTPRGSDVLFPVAVATVFIVVLVVGAILG